MVSVVHFNNRLIKLGIEPDSAEHIVKSTFDDIYKNHDETIFDGVEKKVCFLFMSRSGSTFLVDKLNETGLMGKILEHFNIYKINDGKKQWGVSSTKEYVRRTIAETTSENGVFAFKGHLDSLTTLAQIGELPDKLDEWKFIIIFRRDIVAQTISLARAKATGVWHTQKKNPAVKSSNELISATEYKRNYKIILRKQGAIERFMLINKIEPLRLCYEDFCSDQVDALRQIFKYVGVEAPENLETIAQNGKFKKMANPELDKIAKQFVRKFVSVTKPNKRIKSA